MMKYVTKAVIFTVTVLVSYLLTGLLEDRLLQETERFRPATSTWLGMGIIVLIFVPVFAYTERATEAVVKISMQQTRSGAGRVIGVIFFIILVFAVLFALYLDKWFGLSIGDVL